jgi:hypothetical protein
MWWHHRLVQFLREAIPGIIDGSITLTFRNWSRPQAKTGGRYRTWGIVVEVDDVTMVTAADITDDDARHAGEADAAAVVRRLRVEPDSPVYRIAFHHGGPDDRIARREARLDDERRMAIRARLERLDRASSTGPWTARTLQLIASYPGVVSTALAGRLGMEREPFKLNVRKLKELGLTESLETGYRLSPLGEAYRQPPA